MWTISLEICYLGVLYNAFRKESGYIWAMVDDPTLDVLFPHLYNNLSISPSPSLSPTTTDEHPGE